MSGEIILPSLGKGSKVNFRITLSEEQKIAKDAILKHPYNFILGRAGSGKTLLAVQIGLDMLFKKHIKQIIITRPTVSSEDNGFLPGSLSEKMEPWLVPIRSNMLKVYSNPSKIEKMEEDKDIELVSLSHFRGRTFDNCVVIVDEFQNLTRQQLRMVVGRLGKDSIMILSGDPDQIDLKYKQDSAYEDVVRLQASQYVTKHKFLDNHRHPALREIMELLNE